MQHCECMQSNIPLPDNLGMGRRENKMQTKCLLYSVSYTDQRGFTIKGELLICFFLTKSVAGQVTPIALRVTPPPLHLCGSALSV